MIWRYILFLFFPLLAFASNGDGYDIIERALNFALFFGILWWLLKSKIVQAYEDRISSVADRLEENQAALKESAENKNQAKQKLLKAKEDAKDLIATSKKETELLVKKLDESMENELLNLEKSYEEKISIQRRQMKREVICDVLNDLFEGSAFDINKEEFVSIILKKVA